MSTAIHRMAPARLGPLQPLVDALARLLGLDGGRDFDDDRKSLAESSAATVRAALRGDLEAFAELSRAVEGQPLAFNDGLGAALVAIPLEAVEQAGYRAFAAAISFWL